MRRCLNPIIAYMRYNPFTEKNELSGFKNFNKLCDTFGFKDITINSMLSEQFGNNTVLLPCRKCINCQLNRSQEWAIRNTLESKDYDKNQCLFITLTYDNDNVSHLKCKVINKNNGKSSVVLSLRKLDLQHFIKKLRNVFNDKKIRFFACGEYGGITLRPHYHILLYGLSIDDIKVKHYKDKSYSFEEKYETKNGVFYYSELLEHEIWSKGFVDLSTFSTFTASYVSRYCTKKAGDIKKLQHFVFENGFQDVFNLMSTKPGIAKNYFIKNMDKIYKDDEFLYHFDDKTIKLKPFAYFDKLYDIERPDEFKFIKNNRKDFADVFRYFNELDTDITISEYLRNNSDLVNKKISERSKI